MLRRLGSCLLALLLALPAEASLSGLRGHSAPARGAAFLPRLVSRVPAFMRFPGASRAGAATPKTLRPPAAAFFDPALAGLPEADRAAVQAELKALAASAWTSGAAALAPADDSPQGAAVSIRFDGDRDRQKPEPEADAVAAPRADKARGAGSAGGAGGADDPEPAGAASRDYARMFEITRRALTRPKVRQFLREELKDELVITEEMREQYRLAEDVERVKEVSESQFMLLLMYNEAHWPTIERFLDEAEKADRKGEELSGESRAEWRKVFRELLRDPAIRRKFSKLNDPLKPLRLEWDDGTPGYENARVIFTHQTKTGEQVGEPGDLKKEAIEFIKGATEDLIFNVFDFDLMDMADAFVDAADRGVKVLGGVDGKLVDPESKKTFRPEVKAVFDKLQRHKNIKMVAVDAVGLNHQKMIMRDWKSREKAKALFSSGNFTQSCLGPEGDLCDVPAESRPKDSVPNANHMLIMDSYLMAQAAAHSMLKTLEYGLRGQDYPLSGAVKVFGAKPKGASEAPYFVVTFSPKGGLGDVNRDLTRQLILRTRGPVRLMQFAFSSSAVEEALIERARLEVAENGHFDLKSVGDTSFAVAFWSAFLSLSGYVLEELADGLKRYVENPDAPLRKILGEAGFRALRAAMRIGPPAYRNHHFTMPDGSDREYGAKIHHKVIISGLFAVLATSFNFSEAANSNQEQYLITNDPALVAAMRAGFDGLYALTRSSVEEEVLRRNKRYADKLDDDDGPNAQYQHVDEEARRARAGRRRQ